MYTPRIIVHGGAWTIPKEEQDAHKKGCYKAIANVVPDLLRGMSAREAVTLAIQHLEQDPTYDAGRGAVLREDGTVSLDASIMCGDTLSFAAVMHVRNFLHPIAIAEKLLDKDFSILCSTSAEEFALQQGISPVDSATLIVEREQKRYEDLKKNPMYVLGNAFLPKGTVGAVVRDIHGTIVAGTSTGGVPMAPAGRVGDTPFCGAGTYADNTLGGASATGYGEAIIRSLLTKTAVESLCERTASAATHYAIHRLHAITNSYAGIILIDTKGEYGIYYNTTHMAYAYLDDNATIVASI